MKDKNMIIYDNDMDYGRKLMAYFNQSDHFPFQARIVTTEESLIKITLEEKADVLLLGTMNMTHNIGQVEYVFRFKEEEEEVREQTDIYKFQSMDNIIHIILKVTNKGNGTVYQEKQKGYFYMTGIYSPSGGCGKTRLSMEIVKILSRREKILYLNFDLVGNTYTNEPDIFNNDIQELFYAIHERILPNVKSLESYFCKKDNIYYLGSSPYRRELWNLNKQDIIYWFEFMKEKRDFEAVVLDIGFLNEAMIEVMKQCNKFIVLSGNYDMQKEKMEQFIAMLEFCKENDLIEHMEEIPVCDIDNIRNLAEKLVI